MAIRIMLLFFLSSKNFYIMLVSLIDLIFIYFIIYRVYIYFYYCYIYKEKYLFKNCHKNLKRPSIRRKKNL